MGHRTIPPETMQRFRELYESGLHDGEIAAEIGVTRYTVIRWRKEQGLPSKHGRGGQILYDTPEEHKEAAAAQRKQHREYYIARNRCAMCHKQDAYTLNGRHYCFECVEYRGELTRKSHEKPEIAQNIRDSQNRRAAQRRADGLCISCGKPTRGGKARCERCLAKRKAKAVEQRIESGVNYPRGDNGFCWLCNKRPALAEKRLCAECYERNQDVLEHYTLPARRKTKMRPFVFGRALYGKADAT